MSFSEACALRDLGGLAPSATVAINERSDRLRSDGRDIFKLGLGQSPFPVPRAVVDALRAHAEVKDYLPVAGHPELREAVARHLRRELGLGYGPEDVLIGPGSKELMFQLFLAFEGEIVVPAPAWVSYEPQARIARRSVRRIRTRRRDGFRVRPEQLDAVCRSGPDRPRLLVLNYPCNPTGTTYSERQLSDLAVVARRHGVAILSDEIYGRLHHRGDHVSIGRFYPEATIYSGGLSKWCGAGGWRLGVFAVPPAMRWLRDALLVLASETFTSTCAPVQHAAIVAYGEDESIVGYVTRARAILSALGHRVAETLRATCIDLPEPEGGFYLFADFSPCARALARRGIADDRALCDALLEETGVAILPGSCFGREPGELTARIAYVNFDGGAALDTLAHPGVRADDALVERCCPRTVEAAERIAAWVGR